MQSTFSIINRWLASFQQQNNYHGIDIQPYAVCSFVCLPCACMFSYSGDVPRYSSWETKVYLSEYLEYEHIKNSNVVSFQFSIVDFRDLNSLLTPFSKRCFVFFNCDMLSFPLFSRFYLLFSWFSSFNKAPLNLIYFYGKSLSTSE